ncbi:hypothetical protein V8F20_000118 [Naviculisporaceae sp. PSN 640]
MHCSTVLLSLLTLLPISVLASPVPETPEIPINIQDDLANLADLADLPNMNSTSSDLPLPHPHVEKRDTWNWCALPGWPTFAKSDANYLGNWLQNNNPWSMKQLNHGARDQWTYGSVRLCVKNEYLTENTHVSRWEEGWAVKYIMGKCCSGGGSTCGGGACLAHGDSGLNLAVQLKPVNQGCP